MAENDDPGAGTATGEETPQAPPPQDNKESFYRRKFEKLQGEHEALKRERMSETERTKAERDEARAEAQKAREEAKQLRIFSALEKAAVKAGAHDLDAVAKLADHSHLQISDTGEVLGIEAAIKDLQRNRAYLFGPLPRPSTGSGGGRTTNGTSDKATTASRMDQAIRGKLR